VRAGCLSSMEVHLGRLDVVLNNAGYTLLGTVEEASEGEVHALFKANFFGALPVIQPALPLLRQQSYRHILGVSSGMGTVMVPLIGFYCATKWAVEALHESLAQEVKGLGIKLTLVEPAAYRSRTHLSNFSRACLMDGQLLPIHLTDAASAPANSARLRAT